MQSEDINIQAFLDLLKAGLWETEARLSPSDSIDFSRVLKLAEEQSVVGLIAAGLEHVLDVKVPKEVILQLIGQALQLEQHNQAMNYFIGEMVDKMRKADIYTLLVKGQGVAQCYERPLRRACGDVDFFLSDDNYNKAKTFIAPLAERIERESDNHLGMTIGSWVVELHGNLHCGLSYRIDNVIDEVQRDVFYGGNVRSWYDGHTIVFLPAPDHDVIFIFTHFLKHFYKGGLGLRQICDWCRLLWKYRSEIDLKLLKQRLRKAGLMNEWMAFGALAVDYLGMPKEAMPFYVSGKKWEHKARRIFEFVMMSGNFGHNRDFSYRRYFFIKRKICSLYQRVGDLIRHARIFPLDSLKFFPKIVLDGLRAASKGIG